MNKLKAKEINYYVEYTYLTPWDDYVNDYYDSDNREDALKFMESLIDSRDVKSMYLKTSERFI